MQRSSVLVALGSLVLAAAAHGAAITVREPAFGLPHIYADTDAELARENGREIAKDRLAQLILLARVGRGTLYQAFGLLDPGTLQDDIETRRTGYTSSELNNMFAKLPAAEQTAILEYCKGVNDTLNAFMAGPVADRPMELRILQTLGLGDDLFGNKTNVSDQVDPHYAPPGGAWPVSGFQFTPEMFVSIAILEVRNFGLGGFDEASLLAELQALIAKHGTVAGTQIWDDRNFLNDPLAPVTVPDPTTPGYGGPLAFAAPMTRLAAATRFPRFDWAAVAERRKAAQEHRREFAMRLGAWPMLGSYAWVIGGGKSATGYPWLGGFPQTGIQTPSIMHFAENVSAEGFANRITARGMEFAGAPAVLIGQTDSVAYTSTTAQLRVIDTFLERIIGEDADLMRYDDEGVPAPLTARVETFRGPSPTVRRFFRTHERNGNKGTRPVVDFVGDREGTVDSATATTLVDAGAFDASYIGGHVAIGDGVGAGQIRVILGVPDASTLQVAAWTTTPDTTSRYVAVRPGTDVHAVVIDSTTFLEETTTALGFALLQRAETIMDVRAAARIMPSTHNFPAADHHPFNGIGTASGLGGNIGYWSSGFSRRRQGGLDPRLPMDGTSPSNPLVVASGVVAAATPGDLTAVGSPFSGMTLSPPPFNYRYLNPTDQGQEWVVSITSGVGFKQTRRIAANTASTLAIEFPWAVTPAAGDTFEVYEIVAMPEAINPAEGYLANWNNKAATADEGDDFGREHRNTFILEALAAENAWDRDKQRQLNKDVAGLDGRGRLGRYLVPRLRQAVDRVGNGGEPAVDTVLAALEAHEAAPFLGRYFIDPVFDTTRAGAVFFLDNLINKLAQDIYGDEYGGAVNVPTGSRAMAIVQHAIDSKEESPPGRYAQAYGGDYFFSIDHFDCYRTVSTPGTPRLDPFTVTLEDQFETGPATVRRSRQLCAPANKNDEGLRDPETHLAAYDIRQPSHVTQTNVVVVDQFGSFTYDTVTPDQLLVPTAKALGAPAGAPGGALDHYKCYRIRRAKNGPKFPKGVQVTTVDQLQTRTYDLRKPERLCNPVSVDGSPVGKPDEHLMCYKITLAKNQPLHVRIRGQIHLNNAFGADQRVDTVREARLCVPARKNPAPNTKGWETVVRDALKALAPGGIPADSPRPNSTYAHPLAPLDPDLIFPPTPSGNRGTYEQIVDVGPVVNGEFIFPLGQSGYIQGALTGVTFIDPHVTSLHPLWRDWRFAPMLHVAADLPLSPTGDTDGDGVLDGFERWYFGNLTHAALDDDDGDGLDLLGEYLAGADPTDSDTDDDGVLDGSDSKPQDRLTL